MTTESISAPSYELVTNKVIDNALRVACEQVCEHYLKSFIGPPRSTQNYSGPTN